MRRGIWNDAKVSILKRLFGRSEQPAPEQYTVSVEATLHMSELVSISGTTTVAKHDVAAVMDELDPSSTGHAETVGSLHREAQRGTSEGPVAVVFRGRRIGYLPAYAGRAVPLADGESSPVNVQLFGAGHRVEAWAWLGQGSPQWQWSESNRPPMSSEAKRDAQHQWRQELVREALRDGGERADDFRAGMVDGVHYLETVEPIQQLKREGRLEEALRLCYRAIEGTENEARRDGTSPAPFYTEQAAIVHRKLGQRDEEIAVLRRYQAACPPERRENRIQVRLDKLIGAGG